MNINEFTSLVKAAEVAENTSLVHYQTDVPDFRFGLKDSYVAISFEQNDQSSIMEFRVGLTSPLIKKFNACQGVDARNHSTSKDMLVVRVNNHAFSDAITALVNECIERAVRKFVTRHRNQ